MEFNQKLFLSESLKKNTNRILRRLLKNKPLPPLFLIVIKESGADQLEILPTALLSQGFYQNASLKVVGIADCQSEAFFLVEEISKMVYDNTNDLDIKTYLLAHFKKQEMRR